ncbi:MAG: hypothetical protein HUJ42_02695 [Malacoplasma sp.]|nr:hypothetical protein [Malacoplasma sp.]
MNFPFNEIAFNGNYNAALAVNLIIFAFILLAVPSFLVFLISLVKPKIKEKSCLYLYAFSSAVFIIVGAVGLISEGISSGREFLEAKVTTNLLMEWQSSGLLVLIVGAGAVCGLTVAITFRYFFVKKVGEVHKHHDFHGHDDHILNIKEIDNPKAAWLVIFLILSHRTIDGFIWGGTISELSQQGGTINLGLVIAFNVHIFVEVLIVYYRQVQNGEKRWKAVLNNFYTLLAIIPIMFIGAYVHKYLNFIGWFLPLTNVAGGVIVTFVGVIELVPEFLHHRDLKTKEWYLLIIVFAIGIVLSIVLLTFHEHGGHEETHQIQEQALNNLLVHY